MPDDSYRSNIDQCGKALEDIIFSFGFDSVTDGEPVGRCIVKVVAEDIHETAKDLQQEPKGESFPDNNDAYSRFKEKRYGRTGRSYGFRTGQTLSVESLMGRADFDGERLTMKYGTGQIVSRSDGGSGYIGPSDKQQTDIEKMYILANLAKNRIDVYKVGPYAEKDVKQLMIEALTAHIRDRTGY